MPYFHHFLAESVVNNKCCNYQQPANNNMNNSMLKPVKAGYLLHFKKRLFGKAWREEFVALYEDSSLIWFRDRDRLDPEGGVFLRDAPEMLAAGQWISRVPSRPEFPSGCDPRQAIAIGARNRDKVHWFLCKSESELIDWMSAISHTLPPPPPPPEELRQSRRNLAASANAVVSSTPCTSSSPQFIRRLSSSASTLQSEINGSCYATNIATLGTQFDRKLTLGNTVNSVGYAKTCQNDQQKQRNHQKKLSETSRSYSTGKLIDLNGFVDSSNTGITTINEDLKAETKRSAVTFNIPPSDDRLGKSVGDIAAGVTVAGVLTQLDTPTLAADYAWDWGMGWGWSGYSASYCTTCAMEQAVLINSNIGQVSAVDSFTHSELPSHNQNMNDYLNSYDGDDNDIGDVGGEAADVGADFGDFGF